MHVIRTMGPVALATGLGQVAFTSVVGFLLCLALGLTVVAALYVAVALTFSSTIIIVKLLSDKGEIDALQGRIAVGFLIVQDIVVVLVMIGAFWELILTRESSRGGINTGTLRSTATRTTRSWQGLFRFGKRDGSSAPFRENRRTARCCNPCTSMDLLARLR